ncbi:alpha/beta hydrolase fold domain-containing protein [Salinisphaera sp. Q1T1-3]|uniref:alpha/beta hydrolase fold domain-containing protein n=1 Tax=Salinisphaera sp. Q1T1-3 TaxID=2321229 RepID=UPI0011C3783C|nr:alpha/beta hydrolase fold domain-containing protein [Salinisphaera sp. Q1T1-3]
MTIGRKNIFRAHTDADIRQLVAQTPLAWIVSAADATYATPLPIQIECDNAGRPIAVVGHFARANPQVTQLADAPQAHILVMGPQSYISPSWFRDRTQAPTWNFTCAMFTVRVELEHDAETIGKRLKDLIDDMESDRPNRWAIEEMGGRYEGLARGVVAFRAPIEDIRSTFKVSQDESDTEFADILAALDRPYRKAVRDWILRFGAHTGRQPESTGPGASSAAAHEVVDSELEPALDYFVQAIKADSHRLSAGRELDWPGRRIVAEQVRRRWTLGGPTIAQRLERTIVHPWGDIRLRIYDPEPGTIKPALVYLHGGGWALFSLDTHDRLMREYAAGAGITVIGVDYALAPEHPYPAALEQVCAAVEWIAAHAESLGVDATRIALGGDSAGGNLSLAAALHERDRGGKRHIAALVLNYGAFGAPVDAETRDAVGREKDMLTAAEMDEFSALYRGDATDNTDPLLAPIHADVADLPPTLFIVAERDLLAPENLEMRQRLKSAGVNTTCHIYPGAMHSFLEAMAISRLARQAITDTCTWLTGNLCTEREDSDFAN